MSTEENKALYRRFVEEVINKKNVAFLDKYATIDGVDHNPPAPGLPSGREGMKQVFTMVSTAFPDIQATIDDQIAEGDKVVSRVTFRGTHKGEFLGIPPTGKPVTMGLVDIHRFSGGKVVERWGQADMLGIMQQIGVVPPPGQGGR